MRAAPRREPPRSVPAIFLVLLAACRGESTRAAAHGRAEQCARFRRRAAAFGACALQRAGRSVREGRTECGAAGGSLQEHVRGRQPARARATLGSSAGRAHQPHGFEPVAQALAAGRPVVALESTIITHGMPYPDNSRMAGNVERIIAEEGATPATIAVVDGRIKIGLSPDERETLAKSQGAMKLSRADFGFAVASGPHRRHDRGCHHDRRKDGRHPGLRDRRHRRRPQGRGDRASTFRLISTSWRARR